MKKYKIMGVFAHPDDETFGPGATWAYYASQGHEVYIFTATSGQAGQAANSQIKYTLGDQRKIELHNATKVLGVTELIISEFYDGTLNEHQIPLLKTSIAQEAARIQPDVVITYEPGGISQHLDHIAVTKAVTQLYDEKRIFPKKLYYFGIAKEMMAYWGRTGGIDSTRGARINISSVWEKKREAMLAHRSQRNDFTRILERYEAIKKEGKDFWKYEQFELARTSLKNLTFPETDLLTGL